MVIFPALVPFGRNPDRSWPLLNACHKSVMKGLLGGARRLVWQRRTRKPTTVSEYFIRFIIGGFAVSAFAALGDVFRPKTFAGLFGAAPSIAIATLLIAIYKEGTAYAATEGRSMVIGAVALCAYSWLSCQLMKRYQLASLPSTLLALIAWFGFALGLGWLLLGSA